MFLSVLMMEFDDVILGLVSELLCGMVYDVQFDYYDCHMWLAVQQFCGSWCYVSFDDGEWW